MTTTEGNLLSLTPDSPAISPARSSDLYLALAYLAALSVAEVLTALVEPRAGLVLHSILLATLLIHTALARERPAHKLLLSLAFAPLIRLLSLSLPLAGFPILYWYLIVSAPLFVATLVMARVLGLNAQDMGLTRRKGLAQLGIASTGLLLGAVEYAILVPAPLAPGLTWAAVWLPALILLVSTGFEEELIFRGVMQRVTIDVLGRRWGILYVAALFAILHVGYKSLVDVFFVFAVALFFGWAAERTRSIVGVTFAHGITNIVLFLVMPFLPWFGG
ncbi:MAG: CPBP family intramembrane metalloprotease [Anaerolineae bacterium]|nr:CPBP family intramembrane metalloprotease [Anaerolineae bacterium]